METVERMPVAKQCDNATLPGRFGDLAERLAPRAIATESQLDRMIDMIDALMAPRSLTKGQASYLETLVQLVQAYEGKRHAIAFRGCTPMDALRHLMGEHGMNASDLGRLLGVHSTMGSKILNGDRSLTIGHLQTLWAHFKVGPELCID